MRYSVLAFISTPPSASSDTSTTSDVSLVGLEDQYKAFVGIFEGYSQVFIFVAAFVSLIVLLLKR
jgi:hypothetical protein